MEIEELAKQLRNRLADYRYARKNATVSTHVSTLEIAVCLVEMSLQDKRSIQTYEENWFRAGYYLGYVFANSEWEDLSKNYDQLVKEVRKRNYFREESIK